MIRITPTIAIEEKEIQEDFIRASGPGGQNVNKVSTAVQLRFDVKESPSLPADVKERLIRLGGKRVSLEGVLIIDARRFRTQEKNREDALERLTQLIIKATQKPKPRKKTRPTLGSKKKRLDEKRQRSDIKRLRKPVPSSDD
jgi:ribosome-associated protein